MECREGKLNGRWNEGQNDYMEDAMKGRLYGRWNDGKEDYIE